MSAEVTIRELRNRGGEIVERVSRGERMVVTRDGTPVASLEPLSRRPVPLTVLLERFAHLPVVDPDSLRRDVDAVIDQRL